MTSTATSRSKTSSRDRILQAAIKRFARNSYEKTSLRDIAADVGIDVAYVHRCFGSKEKLFSEAIEAAADLAGFAAGSTDELARSLAGRALSGRPQKNQALGIFIHSIASPEALPILRQFVLENAIEPLSAQKGKASGERAALAMALLTGVALFRNVLRIKPLTEADGGELQDLIADAIRGILDGNAQSGAR
ncbi:MULTISPECIES: TetR family transcriptional regulator [unclassified Bradyrhizobium]|nr:MULTISPECIES: TetR family transcriptional regulator [unclassified Bradyrhizobium]